MTKIEEQKIKFILRIPKNEKKTPHQLIEHYLIEKRLANQLREATKSERSYLYSSLYDELFKQVPDHPQILFEQDKAAQHVYVLQNMKLLKRYFKNQDSFLEIGAGDCSLSREVSKLVKKVYAVDVSKEITPNKVFPGNFELVISNGSTIPINENTIDIAYSNQLMEHLHPDDALEQLQNVYNSLKPRGVYICITPNRISGPHDISRYFDRVATGFHLHEYTFNELSEIFKRAGFRKTKCYIGGRGLYCKFSPIILKASEKILLKIPLNLRAKVTRTKLFSGFLGIIIIGEK